MKPNKGQPLLIITLHVTSKSIILYCLVPGKGILWSVEGMGVPIVNLFKLKISPFKLLLTALFCHPYMVVPQGKKGNCGPWGGMAVVSDNITLY